MARQEMETRGAFLTCLHYLERMVFRLHQRQILKLSGKNIKLACSKFLNGYQAWCYFMNGAVKRLGQYIGHGLCYEAAALMMLIWRDEPTARYCFVSCRDDHGKWVDHCWMELKAYGIWWVIDPAWWLPCPWPRFWYRLTVRSRYHRVVEHDEFWRIPFVEEFYRQMAEPRGSYPFHELTLFRRARTAETAMIWEYCGIKSLAQVGRVGKKAATPLFAVFGWKRPVTPRILGHFIANPRAKWPRRHDYRRALAFTRRFQAHINTAQNPPHNAGDLTFIMAVVGE